MSAPQGRPSADRRPVAVADTAVYVEHGHVLLELTSAEAAVLLHAAVLVRELGDTEVPLSAADKSALSRATRKLTDTVRDQLGAAS